MTAIDISKFSARHFLKSRLVTARSSQDSIATTLAERGLSSIRPISPKNSPGPRMARITSLPSESLIITLSRPESTMYMESVASPPAMMVVERETLFRVTTTVSIRNCSSGTLANSGTAFKTAVETGVAIAEINLLRSEYGSSKVRACKKPFLSIIALFPEYPEPSRNADAPCPTPHPRFGAGRLQRRGLRSAGQPAAGAHYRHRAGRPADDHHGRRQLAGGRRRRAGPGADDPLREARQALRNRADLRSCAARGSESPAVFARRRCSDLYQRRTGDCHRRLRQVPGARLGAEVHGSRRFGLRDLRRLFLQGPERRGGGRRQYRGRRGALPGASVQPCGAGPPPRKVPRRENHGGQADEARRGGQDLAAARQRRRGSARRPERRDRREGKKSQEPRRARGFCHRDQRPGGVRRRGCAGSRLSPGRDQRGEWLHGRSRRGEISRWARRLTTQSSARRLRAWPRAPNRAASCCGRTRRRRCH